MTDSCSEYCKGEGWNAPASEYDRQQKRLCKGLRDNKIMRNVESKLAEQYLRGPLPQDASSSKEIINEGFSGITSSQESRTCGVRVQVLVVMQGASGSGKTTVARSLANYFGAVVCSTDDYHMIGGKYHFQPEKLSDYHRLNQERVKELLSLGHSVIVDNTNVFRWQARPYVESAVALGIPVQFIRVSGEFENVHGVPSDVVKKMRGGLEDLTVETVLASNSPVRKEPPTGCNIPVIDEVLLITFPQENPVGE